MEQQNPRFVCINAHNMNQCVAAIGYPNGEVHLVNDFCKSIAEPDSIAGAVYVGDKLCAVFFKDYSLSNRRVCYLHVAITYPGWFAIRRHLNVFQAYVRSLLDKYDVVAAHLPENKRLCVRVLESAGFKLDGRLRNQCYDSKGICDMLIYSSLKEDYNGR